MLALTMTRGEVGLFSLGVFKADGSAQDLAGLTLKFHAELGIGSVVSIDKDSAAVGGITILVSTGGANCATLRISPADTTSFPPGIYQIPCKLALVSGANVTPLDDGILTMKPPIGA